MNNEIQNNYMKIGKISNAHGIKGTVKIIPLTDDITRFNNLKYVYLFDGVAPKKLMIETVQLNGNIVLIKFDGINTRNEAETLKNMFVHVDREDAITLDEDEYFIEDLIGLNAYDRNNDNIGTVSDIIQTGAVDVLVITGKKNYLIPALKKNVSVSIAQDIIKVDISSGVEYD
jgi:16S rRNA processing protein RimM